MNIDNKQKKQEIVSNEGYYNPLTQQRINVGEKMTTLNNVNHQQINPQLIKYTDTNDKTDMFNFFDLQKEGMSQLQKEQMESVSDYKKSNSSKVDKIQKLQIDILKANLSNKEGMGSYAKKFGKQEPLSVYKGKVQENMSYAKKFGKQEPMCNKEKEQMSYKEKELMNAYAKKFGKQEPLSVYKGKVQENMSYSKQADKNMVYSKKEGMNVYKGQVQDKTEGYKRNENYYTKEQMYNDDYVYNADHIYNDDEYNMNDEYLSVFKGKVQEGMEQLKKELQHESMANYSKKFGKQEPMSVFKGQVQRKEPLSVFKGQVQRK